MAPKPWSERTSLPNSPSDLISAETTPNQVIAESPSPSTLSTATTPSPVPQENASSLEEDGPGIEVNDNLFTTSTLNSAYPQLQDGMPFDHLLPNFIRRVTNQQNLSSVHALSIRVISKVTSLQRMSLYTPNLRELNLEGSMLGSLRDIGCNLKFLQVLKVGKCQLDSLDGTFGLTSLRELYAQKNQITDIGPCSNLPHIRHIDVSHNKIKNMNYAGFLSICPKLRSINFTGNPGTDFVDYREYIKSILPQLDSLDGIAFHDGGGDTLEDGSEIGEPVSPVDYDYEATDNSSLEYHNEKNIELSNLYITKDEAGCSGALDVADEKNKKNVENQMEYVNVDGEVEEILRREWKKDDEDDLELYEEDFTRNCVKNKLLEKAKMIENRNTSLKNQKNIQKLDKDIENRSKKSNLTLRADFGYDDVNMPGPSGSQQYSNSVREKIRNISSLSPDSYAKAMKSLPSRLLNDIDDSDSEPTTPIEVVPPGRQLQVGTFKLCHRDSALKSFTRNNSIESKEEDSGETRQSNGRIHIAEFDDDEDVVTIGDETKGDSISKLTSGVIVCGNLTTALRNRRKQNTAWEDKREVQKKRPEPLILMPKDNKCADEEEKSETVKDGGEGCSCTQPKVKDMQDELLAASRKWRQSFKEFRTSNRTRWEEEDKADYSNLMGRSEDDIERED